MEVVSGVGGFPFLAFFAVPGMILLGVLWLVVGVRLTSGDAMDKSNRIAQLYGYTVCIIAVLTFLLSGSTFLESAMHRSDPLTSDRFAYGQLDYSSFESWKASRESQAAMFDRISKEAARPAEPDSVLRPRYEEMRAAEIANARVRATQGMIRSGFALLAAIVLFVTHWVWLRRQRANGAAAA